MPCALAACCVQVVSLALTSTCLGKCLKSVGLLCSPRDGHFRQLPLTSPVYRIYQALAQKGSKIRCMRCSEFASKLVTALNSR